MEQVAGMCSFDANKSTKGASKLRRDLINSEIANLRDLLPLPSSTRQRLSQLQLMALVCVYVRKANYFQQVWKRRPDLHHITPNIGFAKAMSGFLLMMTQNGKLLYISDNAAEYLGHSMEDLLIHGDSVYDIIDKADHTTVQTELLHSVNPHSGPGEETRLFLCRMNVSRNARRQMRFGDQKVVLVSGHFLSYLPLCSRNEPVFVAVCTPVAMPETRECVVQGATNVFTSIHHLDMKFMHIDRNGEHYLGYSRAELSGMSWYDLVHWSYMREAESKHRLVSQSEQEKSCILLLRLRTRTSDWIWIHCVLQVKEGQESQQTVIVATNQVLSEREAAVMRANAWIYHYYTVQTKLQYGLAYPEVTGQGAGSPTDAATAAARLAAAAYFPSSRLTNYGAHPGSADFHAQHQAYLQSGAHHPMSPDSAGGYSPLAPSLQSPHNGSYPSAHHYHNSFDVRNGKESPLDFSLTTTTPLYEYPNGYPNPYWAHHPHYSSHLYGHLNSRAEDSANNNSAIVASTGGSPQNWAIFAHSPSQNATPAQIHNPTNSHTHTYLHAADSPSTKSSENLNPRSILIGPTKGGHKRMRKSREILSEVGANPHATRSIISDSIILANGDVGSGGTVVMTRPAQYAHLSRPRKMLLSESGEEEVCIKEESGSPSPLWEGQTHRVPDLQMFRTEAPGRVREVACPDLVHCVPSCDTESANTFPYYYPPAGTDVNAALLNNQGAGKKGASAKGASALDCPTFQPNGAETPREIPAEFTQMTSLHFGQDKLRLSHQRL